jgi:hypothetical protein
MDVEDSLKDLLKSDCDVIYGSSCWLNISDFRETNVLPH